jgi:hypothetical protein
MTVNWDHVYDSVGAGWRHLLDIYRSQVEWIETVQPGFKLVALDIKEKWGTLTMYPSYEYGQSAVPMHHLTSALEAYAESRSSQVCEYCGAWGHLRKGGWYKTLCDACHEKGPLRG